MSEVSASGEITTVEIPDPVGINMLGRLFRDERSAGASAAEATRTVLERSHRRLEGRAWAYYIHLVKDARRHRHATREIGLSREAKEVASLASASWMTTDWNETARPWDDLPEPELDALMAVGLMESERTEKLREARAIGALDPTTVDWHDYNEVFAPDRQPEAIGVVFFGCLPGLVAGVMASIVVGVSTGAWGWSVLITVGAAALGHIATIIRGIALEERDREEHLGDAYGPAFRRLYLRTGPAIALALAALPLLASRA